MKIKPCEARLPDNKSDILPAASQQAARDEKTRPSLCFGPCSSRSDRHNRSHPAETTQMCLRPQSGAEGGAAGRHDATLTPAQRQRQHFCSGTAGGLPVNPFHKAETLSFCTHPQTGLPLWPPNPNPTPPWGLRLHGDTTGTHSFGLGLVGRGGASFPGDGDSLPGVWGESGATGAGLLTSVIGSGCGGGGGDGVAALGELGGDGGFVGRLLFTGPSSSSAPPTSEPVCTGGRDSTLGQSSSSLT